MKQGRPASRLGHSLPASIMRAFLVHTPCLAHVRRPMMQAKTRQRRRPRRRVRPTSDATVPDPEPDPGRALRLDLPDATAAVYSEAAVEDALALSIDGLSRLRLRPVFDAYDTAMRQGEDYCLCTTNRTATPSGTRVRRLGARGSMGTASTLLRGLPRRRQRQRLGHGVHLRCRHGAGGGGQTFHVGGYVQKAWTVGGNGFVIEQDNLLGSFLDDGAEAGTGSRMGSSRRYTRMRRMRRPGASRWAAIGDTRARWAG